MYIFNTNKIADKSPYLLNVSECVITVILLLTTCFVNLTISCELSTLAIKKMTQSNQHIIQSNLKDMYKGMIVFEVVLKTLGINHLVHIE